MEFITGDRPLSYVYKILHRPTGRFYFGHRRRNVREGRKSDSDLWIVYFTSSPQVRALDRDECEATVLAEFFKPVDAIRFEQELIDKYWGDKLLVNRAKIKGTEYDQLLKCSLGHRHGPETLEKMSKTRKGRKYSPEHCRKISEGLIGKKVIRSEESKAKYRAIRATIPWTEEGRKHLSEGQRRRFQSSEQRESNRRAGIIAQEHRKIHILRVDYPDGKIEIFKPVRAFAKTIPVTISCVYRHATQHSGRRVETGPLAGYRFSWVDSSESAGVFRN